MALLFDPTTLETIQLSENAERPAVLCENFSWLLQNLHDFEPGHELKDGHWDQKGRGLRREIRSDDSHGLGYSYFQNHKFNEYSPRIDPKGIISISDFGNPINVEKFTISAPWPVKDTGKDEEYYGAGGRENPGGDYTCLVTARYDLLHHNNTRCYVHCSCHDFKFSFLKMLKDKKYTNPNAEVPRKGKQDSSKKARVNADGTPYEVPQAAGICKHIFAVLKTYYQKFIDDEQGPDENPELSWEKEPEEQEGGWTPPPPIGNPLVIVDFKAEPQRVVAKSGTQVTLSWNVRNAIKLVIDQGIGDVSLRQNIVVSPKKSTKYTLTASNLHGTISQVISVTVGPILKKDEKATAIQAIEKALEDANKTLPSDNLFSYLDPRKLSSAKNAAVRYHKYKFAVRVGTDGKAVIYYMNPGFATGNPNIHSKVLNVPGFNLKNSYHLLTTKELHDLVKKKTDAFSPALDKQLEKLRKKGMIVMFYESVIQLCDELEVLNEQSSILRSLYEVNFRNK